MRIDFKTTKLSAVPTSQTYTGRARTSPKGTYSTVRTKRRRHTNENNRNTIRYDTRCYFNVRSKADISQLNLPHGTDN